MVCLFQLAYVLNIAVIIVKWYVVKFCLKKVRSLTKPKKTEWPIVHKYCERKMKRICDTDMK